MRKLIGTFGGLLRIPLLILLATSLVWHAAVWILKIPFDPRISAVVAVFDLIAALAIQDRLIYFFSQFTLPIQNPRDRGELYRRVREFLGGNRGPALFIKNGRIITHEGEAERSGPGVIVLDTASAAVLRTDTEVRDTTGPGVKFTRANEYIAGSVDLRHQWRYIGPLEGDRPFHAPAPSDDPQTLLEVQARRQQTSGLTRDGFEVSPAISIKFCVKRPDEKRPDENGVTSQYGFSARAVRSAVTRELIYHDPVDASRVRLAWNQLPQHLVVNLWREYVRKFKFSELFAVEGEKNLKFIERMIHKRVTEPNVVALDDSGDPTGEWAESIEFRQLEARGLQVTDVRLHNVFFDPAIEDEIVRQWSAEWLNIARREQNQLQLMESLVENASREEASKSFARIVSQRFGGKPSAPHQNPFQTLQLLIMPLKEFLLGESMSGGTAEDELRRLDEIWKWLLDNYPSGAPKHDGGVG